jgi:hypothetical protein
VRIKFQREAGDNPAVDDGSEPVELFGVDTNETEGDWVTIRRIYTLYTRIQRNIHGLIRKVEGPRPFRWVRNPAKLGNWHPSTTDITISSATDSHPLSVVGLD